MFALSLNLKFGNFTLSFGRLRQRNVLKCVPHGQHDYFSSFNQWDHCVLASLLPSSLLKLLTTNSNFARVARAISIFEHFSAFSSFPRCWREMTCFVVMWTTWAHDIKFSVFFLLSPNRWYQFNCRILKHFASIMTWNNCFSLLPNLKKEFQK